MVCRFRMCKRGCENERMDGRTDGRMVGTFVQAFACMYVVQQGIRGLCFYRATSTNKTSHIIMLLSNVISDLQSVCQNIVHSRREYTR